MNTVPAFLRSTKNTQACGVLMALLILGPLPVGQLAVQRLGDYDDRTASKALDALYVLGYAAFEQQGSRRTNWRITPAGARYLAELGLIAQRLLSNQTAYLQSPMPIIADPAIGDGPDDTAPDGLHGHASGSERQGSNPQDAGWNPHLADSNPQNADSSPPYYSSFNSSSESQLINKKNNSQPNPHFADSILGERAEIQQAQRIIDQKRAADGLDKSKAPRWLIELKKEVEGRTHQPVEGLFPPEIERRAKKLMTLGCNEERSYQAAVRSPFTDEVFHQQFRAWCNYKNSPDGRSLDRRFPYFLATRLEGGIKAPNAYIEETIREALQLDGDETPMQPEPITLDPVEPPNLASLSPVVEQTAIDPEHAGIWQRALNSLELEMSPGAFTTHVRYTRLIAVRADGTYLVHAPNAFVVDWLTNRLTVNTLRVLRTLTTDCTGVEFVTN